MQPDNITPAAARITSLNFSDDIMLVQSSFRPIRECVQGRAFEAPQLSPRRDDSLNHVFVSIEQSHYRRNRPEFQNLDTVPAMRQSSVTFLPQVFWLPAHFWADELILAESWA
jgi:hypothetical protein